MLWMICIQWNVIRNLYTMKCYYHWRFHSSMTNFRHTSFVFDARINHYYSGSWPSSEHTWKPFYLHVQVLTEILIHCLSHRCSSSDFEEKCICSVNTKHLRTESFGNSKVKFFIWMKTNTLSSQILIKMW